MEFHQDKEITSLRYKGEVMKLNNIYFNKLVRNILDINLKLTFYKRQLVRAISPILEITYGKIIGTALRAISRRYL